MGAKNKEKGQGIASKSQLAIVLSGLDRFYEGKVRLEQYSTPSEIAADMLWNAYLQGDIEGKVIADLGCGTGILGIGGLLLGAKRAYFVDIDEEALEIAKKNIEKVKSEGYTIGDSIVSSCNIGEFKGKVDVVLENPPFGVKINHNDRYFLENAFKTGKVVYSFHKSETKSYLEVFGLKMGFEITHEFKYRFGLPPTMKFHAKRVHYVGVSCFRFCRL